MRTPESPCPEVRLAVVVAGAGQRASSRLPAPRGRWVLGRCLRETVAARGADLVVLSAPLAVSPSSNLV